MICSTGSSTICEVHFTKESFVEKKDRVFLDKDAVPTIFFKPSSLGLEMVQVPYDAVNHQYFGKEGIELLRGDISVEDEEAVTNKRQEKLVELKSLCRFCFCSDAKNENKCVSIAKLDSYQINLDELMTSLGLTQPTSDILGELVCEQCFQQIVEIDLFKKKCRDAQEEVLSDVQELENKIQEIRNNKSASSKTWSKLDIGIRKEETIPAASIEVLEEEHLVEDGEFDDANYQYDPQMEVSEEYIEEIHDGYKIIYQQVPEINESDDKLFKENDFAESDLIAEDINVQDMGDVKELDEDKLVQGVDEYEACTDAIIKNPERNRFCFRIYECFFCRMVSLLGDLI